MACLRESAVDGRFGTLSCYEEGCVFRLNSTDGSTWTSSEASEADCVLQLRLRAGDPEDTVVGWMQPLIDEELARAALYGQGLSVDDELKPLSFDFRLPSIWNDESSEVKPELVEENVGEYQVFRPVWANGPMQGQPGPSVRPDFGEFEKWREDRAVEQLRRWAGPVLGHRSGKSELQRDAIRRQARKDWDYDLRIRKAFGFNFPEFLKLRLEGELGVPPESGRTESERRLDEELEEWRYKHEECGGTLIRYIGEYEFRIGCTCGDKE